MTDRLLSDLARAKALFQQRALEAMLRSPPVQPRRGQPDQRCHPPPGADPDGDDCGRAHDGGTSTPA